MAAKKRVNPLQKPIHPALALMLIGLVGIGGIIALVFRSNQNPIHPPRQYQSQTTLTSVPSPTLTLPTPIVKTYVSSDLGISFQYNIGYPGAPDPKEIGNKIYLGPANDDSIYVQVLTKDPSDTLETAVRKQFLQGYSDQKCLFSDNLPNIPINMPSQYIHLSYIRLRVEPADKNQNLDNVQKTDCPAYLIGQDGESYFLMDTRHPNKFLFFHIGGGNFPGGRVTWDNTVQFLD